VVKKEKSAKYKENVKCKANDIYVK